MRRETACFMQYVEIATKLEHSAILAIEKFWVNARKFGMWI